MKPSFVIEKNNGVLNIIKNNLFTDSAPSIFNTTPNDPTKEPMFFGQGVNISRFDTMKYPVFDEYTKKQLSLFWQPEEVELTKDVADFANLKPHEQHIFTANLRYQTLLDSIQGRGPMELLLPIVSIPEMEPWLNVWSSFESTLHSRGYSYIIQTIYPNPEEVLGKIIVTDEIIERANAIAAVGDKLMYLNTLLRCNEFGIDVSNVGVDIKSDEFKRLHIKTLILYLFSIYLVESVRFYVSFSCSFAFAERSNSVMEGNAKIIKLIARDEACHTGCVQNILNILRFKEGEMYFEIYEECIPEMIELAKQCREQEREWTRYLFKDGSIIGLNEETSYQYIDHLIDRNIVTVGLPPLYGSKSNPYPWIKEWFNSDSVQVAPQETEVTSYVTAVDGNVTEDELGALGSLLD